MKTRQMVSKRKINNFNQASFKLKRPSPCSNEDLNCARGLNLFLAENSVRKRKITYNIVVEGDSVSHPVHVIGAADSNAITDLD